MVAMAQHSILLESPVDQQASSCSEIGPRRQIKSPRTAESLRLLPCEKRLNGVVRALDCLSTLLDQVAQLDPTTVPSPHWRQVFDLADRLPADHSFLIRIKIVNAWRYAADSLGRASRIEIVSANCEVRRLKRRLFLFLNY